MTLIGFDGVPSAMFVRSDTLLRFQSGGRALHAVALDWDGFEPRLWAWNRDSGGLQEVDLWELGLNVTTGRYCVGSFGDGGYEPCPSRRRVDRFAQCADCAAPRIPDQECTFEPKCDGTRCGASFCLREHSVYLAFHCATAKVGMSSSSRVQGRLVEQGADAYAVLARSRNRLDARRTEVAVAAALGARQRISARESLRNMACPTPWAEIEAQYAELAARAAERLGLSPGPLRRLEGHPLVVPLKGEPALRETLGPHSGRVLGMKGRYLVYENGGLTLDLQDLPSRTMRA